MFKRVLQAQVGKARCKKMRMICLVAKASLPSNVNISLRPDCNSDFSFVEEHVCLNILHGFFTYLN